MRPLGLIGGMSWESTALYYRRLNERVRERLGGLHSAELRVHSFDFAPIAAMQAAGHWDEATGRLVRAAQALEAGGAAALLICTNTMHRMADAVQAAVRVPLLHIVDPTARAIRAAGGHRPLLLGTRFTMEGDFYLGRLRTRFDLDPLVPDAAARALVDRVIYEELCRGMVSAASQAAYRAIVERARRDGADGVIFGCTEIGLLLGGVDLGMPVYDSVELHCEAAARFALGDDAD
ncbi:MAG TPA: aspartate/glutamate racemase family protein [Lysobacter sp.]|nr:aspartate/glutamate racemase family protein [Lysobacter sp.]